MGTNPDYLRQMHIPKRETHQIGRRTRERMVGPGQCPSLVTCGIRLTGHSDARAGFTFVRPYPHQPQVLVCHAGVGAVWVEGRWQKCGAGQAYVTPAGPLHAYHAIRGKSWEVCWVTFSSDASASVSTVPGDAPRLVACDPRPLLRAIDGLLMESMEQGSSPQAQQWARLVRDYALRIAGPPPNDPRLAPLWLEVDRHLAHPWTLPELARHAHMSVEHLRRLCQASLKCSPLKQVMRLRMKRAAALLEGTERKVEDIAQEVGYGDPFAFSTAFRRWAGQSPKYFREGRR